ncbi:MAG: Ldh family oxidoreductase [Chloroflexi bacterium]|nr:Ldh family oxidoreductase [Chloroflexota bacterium]
MTAEHATTVELTPLQRCIQTVLVRLGVADDEAEQIADVLVDAELRGYPDHGVWFLGEVAGWFRSRALNPRPSLQVVRETDVSLLLDGDGGCGVVASYRAMDWCVQRARERGVATAAIQRSGHFIAAAPFVTRAARAGCIGVAAANVSPLMAPPGGRTRTLGTNPFAFAAPTGGDFPLVFDMATTAIAGFKVRLAAREGRQLEPGLIADAQGRPSDDPRDFLQGGLLLPVGGHKGFGLALMVEVLAGVLSGASFGADAGVTNGREGHFFLALNPDVFMTHDEFIQRMDELVRQVKAGERAEGVQELFVPGERGQRRAAELRRSGQVPLDAQGWSTLQEVCGSVDLEPPPIAGRLH